MKKKWMIWGMVCLLAALTVAAVIALKRRAVVSDIPVFQIADPRGGHLRLRYESSESAALLITREKKSLGGAWLAPAVSYRYDPASRVLTEVPLRAWTASTTEIAKAETMAPRPPDFLVSLKEGTLHVGLRNEKRQRVKTTGEHALELSWCPCGDRVAVLTVDGRQIRKKESWVFGAVGGYPGQHYIELFDLPGMMTKRRPAIRIPFTTVEGIDSPCWTLDGDYMVITSGDKTRLCVIDTRPSLGDQINAGQ
ncbi:MAG: hypothetical protein PVI86_06360 [Phycisphaerae bacterium]|jgi:hypothetical protein